MLVVACLWPLRVAGATAMVDVAVVARKILISLGRALAKSMQEFSRVLTQRKFARRLAI
jgi:hypothetical protein